MSTRLEWSVTLNEARRYAVKKQTSIEFRTTQGMACVIDLQGVARVPELKSAPGFLLTDEFEQAREFVLIRGGQRKPATRDELSQLAGPAQAAAHDHDDDE
jgi:hypothetical protein